MEQITALLLSLFLLLSAGGMDNADTALPIENFSVKTIQIPVQKPVTSDAIRCTITGNTTLFVSPSRDSNAAAMLKKGETLELLRTDLIGAATWAFVHSPARNLDGWVPANLLSIYSGTPTATTPTAPTTPYVPSYPAEAQPPYARMGVVVNTSQLNVRRAPGVDQAITGEYQFGDRVGIMETNGDWGRTVRGWICLDYVYFDGTMTSSSFVGRVTATRLNVRSGPGTQYLAGSSLYDGDFVLILATVQTPAGTWGYTRLGWVSMGYISGQLYPGGVPAIAGVGYVTSGGATLCSTPGGSAVKTLSAMDIVIIQETKTVDGVLWGRTDLGWIPMGNVHLTLTVIDPEKPDPEEPGSEEPGSGSSDPDDSGSDSSDPDDSGSDAPDPDDSGSGSSNPDDSGSGSSNPDDSGSGSSNPDDSGSGSSDADDSGSGSSDADDSGSGSSDADDSGSSESGTPEP